MSLLQKLGQRKIVADMIQDQILIQDQVLKANQKKLIQIFAVEQTPKAQKRVIEIIHKKTKEVPTKGVKKVSKNKAKAML